MKRRTAHIDRDIRIARVAGMIREINLVGGPGTADLIGMLSPAEWLMWMANGYELPRRTPPELRKAMATWAADRNREWGFTTVPGNHSGILNSSNPDSDALQPRRAISTPEPTQTPSEGEETRQTGGKRERQAE